MLTHCSVKIELKFICFLWHLPWSKEEGFKLVLTFDFGASGPPDPTNWFQHFTSINMKWVGLQLERRRRKRRREGEGELKKQENKVCFLLLSLPSAHWFLCAQSRNKPRQSVHLFLRYLNKQITKINQCETSKPDQSVFRSPSALTASGETTNFSWSIFEELIWRVCPPFERKRRIYWMVSVFLCASRAFA